MCIVAQLGRSRNEEEDGEAAWNMRENNQASMGQDELLRIMIPPLLWLALLGWIMNTMRSVVVRRLLSSSAR